MVRYAYICLNMFKYVLTCSNTVKLTSFKVKCFEIVLKILRKALVFYVEMKICFLFIENSKMTDIHC